MEGTLRALGGTGFLTQGAEPIGKTIVDARKSFNELRLLAMLWNVRNRCPVGARFALNCYKYWMQLIIRQPGELPVMLLIREEVTQVDPLSMVLCGINIPPLGRGAL